MKYPDNFEQLWKEYPPRAGGRKKPLAFKAFTARLKEKVHYSDLQAGVLRYYNYCKGMGMLNTPYVMQASTFFSVNTESWDEPWDLPVNEAKETTEQKGKRLNMPAKIGESMEAWERRISQSRV